MGSTPREIRADSVGSRQAKYLHANLCFFDYLVISDLPQDLNKFDDCCVVASTIGSFSSSFFSSPPGNFRRSICRVVV